MICGGGTAGHIYPGLALAEALEKLSPGCRTLFVGADGGLENTLLPRLGKELRTLPVRGLPRSLSPKAFGSMFLMARAYLAAGRMLADFQPDAVVGMGGYASLPVAYSAWRHGLPVVIHEQNSVPGMVNRFLAKRCTAVALTFPDTARFFTESRNVSVPGNPVRADIVPADRLEARRRFGLDPNRECVLAIGGSRGAKSINDAAMDMYEVVRNEPSLQVMVITGVGQYDDTERTLASQRHPDDKVSYRLLPYVDDISWAYAAADVAVSRAGSGAIAELAVCGRPCVLVPYPWATDDHQRLNAAAVTAAGAGAILDNDDLSGRSLWDALSAIMGDPDKLRRMSAAALRFGRPGAASSLAEIVLQAAGR